MVYIDFGHHPGKDRIPREAAMRKCVVIASTFGSCGNNVDVPLLSEFKIDAVDSNIQAISDKIRFVFENYESQLHKQDFYRQTILNEHALFQNQVKTTFN